MIAVVDYGMGNLRSVAKALERLGVKSIITSHKKDFLKADKIILPGVGYFSTGMNNLKDYGLLEIINKRVLEDKIPILGICLGMQLFSEWGEEGDAKGLGWIKGKTIRFDFQKKYINLRIPHIGWNSLYSIKKKNYLLEDISNDTQFYFVHSYHVNCDDKNDVMATSSYGYEFTSVINKNNIYGTQFHPEKSHKTGLKLLKNFIKL